MTMHRNAKSTYSGAPCVSLRGGARRRPYNARHAALRGVARTGQLLALMVLGEAVTGEDHDMPELIERTWLIDVLGLTSGCPSRLPAWPTSGLPSSREVEVMSFASRTDCPSGIGCPFGCASGDATLRAARAAGAAGLAAEVVGFAARGGEVSSGGGRESQ